MSGKHTFRMELYPFEVKHEVATDTGQVYSELVQDKLVQVEEYLPGLAQPILFDPARRLFAAMGSKFLQRFGMVTCVAGRAGFQHDAPHSRFIGGVQCCTIQFRQTNDLEDLRSVAIDLNFAKPVGRDVVLRQLANIDNVLSDRIA